MPNPQPNEQVPTVFSPPGQTEAANIDNDQTTVVGEQPGSDTPKPSVQQVMDRLVQGGLMSAAEAKAIQGSLAAESRLDTDSLIAELLRQEKLTRFQVDALLNNIPTPLTLGEYILQEKIGAGGMGQVYKALHRRMDRTVALKLLPRQAVTSANAVQRFQREVKAAAKLSHPNIVAAYDAGQQDSTPYFVMEYIPAPICTTTSGTKDCCPSPKLLITSCKQRRDWSMRTKKV
jgi:serine/threonine protein kinase